MSSKFSSRYGHDTCSSHMNIPVCIMMEDISAAGSRVCFEIKNGVLIKHSAKYCAAFISLKTGVEISITRLESCKLFSTT
jgi:hypothetical protein